MSPWDLLFDPSTLTTSFSAVKMPAKAESPEELLRKSPLDETVESRIATGFHSGRLLRSFTISVWVNLCYECTNSTPVDCTSNCESYSKHTVLLRVLASAFGSRKT